jgi:hypothetical protein
MRVLAKLRKAVSRTKLTQMKHPELRWNPGLQEWFCVRCGLTSDHSNREGAETELESFECELPPTGRRKKTDSQNRE